jgi:hypothetical protein
MGHLKRDGRVGIRRWDVGTPEQIGSCNESMFYIICFRQLVLDEDIVTCDGAKIIPSRNVRIPKMILTFRAYEQPGWYSKSFKNNISGRIYPKNTSLETVRNSRSL